MASRFTPVDVVFKAKEVAKAGKFWGVQLKYTFWPMGLEELRIKPRGSHIYYVEPCLQPVYFTHCPLMQGRKSLLEVYFDIGSDLPRLTRSIKARDRKSVV